DRPGSYLIADDSVQDKRHSRVMERVKRQYSGNAHGLVKGIGIVNLVHSDGTDHDLIDFRVYAPEMDGLTKNEHFRDMLREAYRKKGIQAQTILFDTGYAASDNLKFIHRLGKTLKKTGGSVSAPGTATFASTKSSGRRNGSNMEWKSS
ncbi:MAG: hypothetical protein V9G98_08635, partial [Candidatus Competibacter sp.]